MCARSSSGEDTIGKACAVRRVGLRREGESIIEVMLMYE
jgi:hypothetical protein